MKIAVYTLTSMLHDEQSVGQMSKEFLASLHMDYDFRGNDFADYGTHTLDLIYIRTGGTEGLFRQLLPELQSKSNKPFYLLASSMSNSLPASLEILSYLQQMGLQGEILHGHADYVSERIALLTHVSEARAVLHGCRLGVLGQPSDWLIASKVSAETVRNILGIMLVDVAMDEVMDEIRSTPVRKRDDLSVPEHLRASLPGAMQIYDALKAVVSRHQLQGLTLRCFDLLSAVHNTGCLALARLNAEGIVAGCEGDVPALLSMMVVKSLTGMSGFQANPARIDPVTGELLMAHCTIPLDMVSRYEYDTHFESGIGIGIRGYMNEGPVTIFKLSGDLSRHFIAEGTLVCNQAKPGLCRTQQVIRLKEKGQANYFLTHPIGNHHIVVPGHHAELLAALLG